MMSDTDTGDDAPGLSADAPLLMIGGGGHTRVLADILIGCGLRPLGILSQDASLKGTEILGIPVLGSEEECARHAPEGVRLINGVGNRARAGDSGLTIRAALVARHAARGFTFASVLSPYAIISRHAVLGEAVQLLHGAVVQAGATIGAHTIINTRAVVEHDCRIGAFCHIAPSATLCGGVVLGHRVHVGAGAVILPGVHLGDGAIVPAGSCVRFTKDIPS